MRIVIPGGTGQVGQLTAGHFHAQGHEVTVLSRRPRSLPWKVLPWNGRDLGPWTQAIDGADVILNLTGRSVNCRYTKANRREIKESRVQSTQVLGRAIAECVRPPRLWMNASTATIYRHALDRPMDEANGELGGGEPGAPATWNFSIDVAKSWEQAFFEAATPATRKLALRSAMIMSPTRGGVFATLLALVKLGLGGAAGAGNQYVSWIHQEDFLSALDLLIAEERWSGVVNLSSPNPIPNREFMRLLREAQGVPFGLPAKRWMLEIATFVHRTESELLLKSRRVVPGRWLEAGFHFKFPEWAAAARDLIAVKRAASNEAVSKGHRRITGR